MEIYLIDFKGNQNQLPVLLWWNLSYGCGLPCDAFEIGFIYDKKMLNMLSDTVRLRAVFEGETVFFGVVDEFEVSVSESGSIVSVRGRGLAALLLDNESEAAQYYSASLDQILENYVLPLGITQIQRNVVSSPLALTVDSGSSYWRVLEDYLWFGCGARPRFSKDGVLILGEAVGECRAINAKTAVFSHNYRYRRYGVISEVIVKNKALGITKSVLNEEFASRGGNCKRVLNVPRKTRFDSMRATGEYQIKRSSEEMGRISLKLPALFAAFPGDVIELYDSPLGLEGAFFVDRAVCYASGEEMGTEIILTRQVG